MNVPNEDPTLTGDGWKAWGNHVLVELKRLNEGQVRMENKMNKVHVDLAMLKVKSGLWGLLGASIPVIIALGIWAVKSSGQ
jgi:hypothetical protein